MKCTNEVRVFMNTHFTEEAIALLDGVEVRLIKTIPQMAAMFTTVDDNNEFNLEGTPVLGFNPDAEVYSIDKDLLTPGIVDSIIVHELTHYRQVEQGRLKIIDQGRYIWEGEEVTLPIDVPVNDYLELPWELEAFMAQADFIEAETGRPATVWWEDFKAATLGAA